MTTDFLFPYRYRKLGWALFLLGAFLFIAGGLMDWSLDFVFLDLPVFALFNEPMLGDLEFMTIIENNIIDEIVVTLLIVGGCLAAFSKEKENDEMIDQIRLNALLWAVYVNYGILLFCTLFTFGLSYLHAVSFNIFTLILIFMVRYKWLIYKLKGE